MLKRIILIIVGSFFILIGYRTVKYVKEPIYVYYSYTNIKYDERTGVSKLKFNDFFRFLYTIFSLLFYYKPFKIIIPLMLPFLSAFLIFLIQDIYSNNLTDKTVLLFNFNFIMIILLFIIDRINKIK